MLESGDRCSTTRKSRDFTSFDARLVPPTTCLFHERQLYKFLLARDLETLPGRSVAGKQWVWEKKGFAILPSMCGPCSIYLFIGICLMTKFVTHTI